MNTFEAKILTPEGTVFDGDITGLKAPGIMGNFEVKVNHAPIISTLDIGSVRIRHTDNPDEMFAISGGFLEMNDNKLTLLAESAESAADIDLEEARKAKSEAEKRLSEADDEKQRREAREDLREAKNRIFVAES